ncbi:DUF4330 domain-containing protein [Halorussus salinisoli]|uniref:DUF4330 domain-containing protein n=1 Tax=Halorussus salinisoli TaxID=2558242 RepID=UPI0010C19474|nr:DUF4330 domain-containing protein [Halorussus salinisoli]
MTFIDDKGRLFGTINIIDVLAVCLVLVATAGGTTFVLTADDTDTDQQNTSITFEITDVQPYVVDAIPEGQIDSDTITAVENKSVQPSQVVVADQHGELHERPHPEKKTVTLQLALATTTSDEEIQFDGEPLQVGRELSLDLGTVTVEGNVTSVQTNS